MSWSLLEPPDTETPASPEAEPRVHLVSMIERILRARVYDVARETPLDAAPALSRRLGNWVHLKREDLQPVFSFKLRGAYNKMCGLPDAARAAGVIAASAGNHAQGVALSARRLDLEALIVMPRTTPEIKVRAVANLGAQIELWGDSYDDACTRALEIARERGLSFIHPYDDLDVIAGQGTIGMEILRQCGARLNAVFVPVGGGGLVAGIAAYVKFVQPQVRVIGVEPEDAACLYRALRAGQPVALPEVGLFADGVAVKKVGEAPFRIARNYVDEVILVSTDEICAAIRDIFDDTRAVAEPAGALSIAGMKKFIERERVRDQKMVAIVSGANINFDRLRYVAERAQVGEHREILLGAVIPETPGSFLRFCLALGSRSVTEFNYRYFDATDARVFAGVEIRRGHAEREEVIEDLRCQGFAVTDMTENELAKEHMRYMVGGHAPCELRERVFRLEFPERPGALQQFLSAMGGAWNITLFHYRNHGAAFGQVLVGVQMVDGDAEGFRGFLDRMGYVWGEETLNPAYRFFAGGNEPFIPETESAATAAR